MNRLAVSEIFTSIQGESSFAGRPCLFVRLAGCNLRCSWCDARYTYEEPASSWKIGEIVAQADRLPQGFLVEVTGGEPLLQEAVYPLLQQLTATGRTVLLETNGSLLINRVPKEVVVIMDVKCPASGMAGRFEEENLNLLKPMDEIKFVLAHRQDYDWACGFLERHSLWHRFRILFSPVTSALAPRELAGWILADGLPVQLQLQLHTLLWPEKRRGA